MSGISLDLDVQVPVDERPDAAQIEALKRRFVDLLARSGVNVDEDSINASACPQATYEDCMFKISASVTTREPYESVRLAAEDVSRRWCEVSRMSLEHQPHLHFANQETFAQDATPSHENVPVHSVHLGAQVNSGLFRSYHGIVFEENQPPNVDCSVTTVNELLLDLHHDRGRLFIKFACQRARLAFKLEIQYGSVLGVLATPSFDGLETIYLMLKHPPLVYESVPRSKDGLRKVGRTTLAWNGDWKRMKEFYGCPLSVGVNCSIMSITTHSDRLKQVANKASGPYNMRTPPTFCGDAFFHMLGRLKSKMRTSVGFAPLAMRTVERRIVHQRPYWELVKNRQITLSTYRATYALEALLRRGLWVTSQLDHGDVFETFMEMVQTLSELNPDATEIAMERLLDAVDERRNITLIYALHKIYTALTQTQANGDHLEPDIPQNCLRVRKILVTPSRLILLPPELLMGNRVLRRFGHEGALRVGFSDENGWRLGKVMGSGWVRKFAYDENHESGAFREARELSEDTVRDALLRGLQVAGKHYKFLGWSNSQMRDHGCYMYMDTFDADGQMVTVETIRTWTGNWNKPMSVAKMMARMGQCFTQAQDTIELTKDQYTTENDIKSKSRNPEDGSQYIFSDGVGRISEEAAADICTNHNPPIHPVPAAFQVRYGGFKGMLSVDPNLNSKKKKKNSIDISVVFRKSMQKFDAQSSEFLEVVKYSLPCPVFLNRPLVMILDQVSEKQDRSHRGVHARVTNRIRELVEEELFAVTDMLCNESDSVEVLEQRTNAHIQFSLLRRCGLNITLEPFFRSMLLAVHRSTIVTQMHKLKVRVSMERGRTMFGILDETSTLQYGQVYVRYSVGNPSDCNSTVLTGQVMVTKNPCVVSGDVRILEAVDVPKLKHCVDVIVFPRYGERPHTDEMAGSDLDGDEYSVYWDPMLKFAVNEEPLHRKTMEDKRHERIQNEQMVDFFVKHMHMDSIGQISDAHLANADRYGIEEQKCQDIALKHSCQVDFPKTGMPPPALTGDERPQKFPDFMERESKPMYRSRRLVGELYRQIKRLEAGLDVGQETLSAGINENLLRPGRVAYEEKAKESMLNYTSQLQALVDQYGVEDEGALVSGHITIIRRRLSNREKEDFSFYNTDKLIEMRYENMYKRFRAEFFEDFGPEKKFLSFDQNGRNLYRVNPEKVIRPDMLDKASAWYAVTYGTENRTPFRSFAWIAWDLLCEVHAASDPPTLLFDPMQQILGQTLDQVCIKEKKDQFLPFFKKIREENAIKVYCNHYKGLEQLFFALSLWAEGEGLLSSCRMEIEHYCLLLIQFAIGTVFNTQEQLKPIDLANQSAPSTTEPEMSTGIKGTLLLTFVRFLSSRLFRTQSPLNFSKLGVRSRWKLAEWLPVSDAALTTFHTVAVTGKFDALHLCEKADTKLSHDFGELNPPIAIDLKCRYSDHGRMAQVLKEQSGAHDVKVRRPDPWNPYLMLVSATGTAQARVKLRDILLVQNAANEDDRSLKQYFEQHLGSMLEDEENDEDRS